jgi:hypothetical protein
MDVTAFGASQRPVLKPRTAGRDALNARGSLALRTARPNDLAWRKGVGLQFGHVRTFRVRREHNTLSHR